MRPMTTPDDPAADAATATRLLALIAAHRPAVVLAVMDGDDRVPVALRDVNRAIQAALPTGSVRIGRDFWTGRTRVLSLVAWHDLVERHIQALTARVRELEAAQSPPLAVTVTVPPPIAVERRTTVERDANSLITATRTRDVPIPAAR